MTTRLLLLIYATFFYLVPSAALIADDNKTGIILTQSLLVAEGYLDNDHKSDI